MNQDVIEGRWKRAGWPGWGALVCAVVFGPSSPLSRSAWVGWFWRAFVLKWLRAPVSCKLGTHAIGAESDTGFGGCGPGTMDVWCLRCDAALSVPIDDAMGIRPDATLVIRLFRGKSSGNGDTTLAF